MPLQEFLREGPARPVSRASALVVASALLLAASADPRSAQAATTTNLVVNPITAVFDSKNVTGVQADSAPGFPSGSLASGGASKTDIYFTPAMLFGHAVTLGDLKSIRYWTKTGALHAVDPRDWFLAIYTDPFAGDVSTPGWYGDRIGSEPYFSASIADPANTWNQWATDGATNRLRFFQSTAGAPGASFGSYTDPDWDTFVAGNSLGTASPLAGHSILYLSVQTGSAWAAGFTGKLDGLRVELQDGSVANVNFEFQCVNDAECETDGSYCTYDKCNVTDGTCSAVARDCSTDQSVIDFEAPLYTAGSINGQDGWSSLGASGSGCAVYDHAVSSSLGTFGYAAQSLRISNAVTSGCFGDQTFTKSTTDEVGETTAANGGKSGGTRRTHFESEFDIASAVPGAEQPGLFMSTSADRGDGSRMTYLRFEDSPTGLQVYFDDYQDAAPYGSIATPAPGCGVEDDFIETQVGVNLDRSVPHSIRETLDVVEGPLNDVVKVYIDDVLVHTGTSWEDYFRWCEATGTSRTVDSRLFRTGGGAAPGTLGNGFLIDNVTVKSGTTEGTVCNDTCNESSDTCENPAASPCTDDGNPCTDDLCDGAGNCTHVPNTASCDDGVFCNGADTCGGGTCSSHAGDPCTGGPVCADTCNETADNCFVLAGTVCRAAAGSCDVAETCTGISAGCPVDEFVAAATVCRASGGVCDVAETCTGSAAACPSDAKSTAVCRASAGVCDVAESCDGVANACPADAFVAAAAVCRASGGVCDVAETCTGSAAACPADAKSTAVCRASAGVCDVAESCNGVANACPADAFVAAATVCRASGGVCDVADTCTGSAAACPADAKSTATCRASAGACDLAETCDGSSNNCPADAKSTAVCRASAGVCDVAETCDGASNNCPVDAFVAASTVCRGAAGVCDVAESCTGAAAACPVDAFASSGTACASDSNGCTDDVCDGSGTCAHPVSGTCLALDVTYVKVKQDTTGGGNGGARVKGSFITGPPADVFDASNAIGLAITDELTLDVVRTWAPAECSSRGTGIMCRSADGKDKAMFVPVSNQAGVFRMRARFSGLTVEAPFAGTLSVTLTHGPAPTSRAGGISDCHVTANGVKCTTP